MRVVFMFRGEGAAKAFERLGKTMDLPPVFTLVLTSFKQNDVYVYLKVIVNFWSPFAKPI